MSKQIKMKELLNQVNVITSNEEEKKLIEALEYEFQKITENTPTTGNIGTITLKLNLKAEKNGSDVNITADITTKKPKRTPMNRFYRSEKHKGLYKDNPDQLSLIK